MCKSNIPIHALDRKVDDVGATHNIIQDPGTQCNKQQRNIACISACTTLRIQRPRSLAFHVGRFEVTYCVCVCFCVSRHFAISTIYVHAQCVSVYVRKASFCSRFCVHSVFFFFYFEKFLLSTTSSNDENELKGNRAGRANARCKLKGKEIRKENKQASNMIRGTEADGDGDVEEPSMPFVRHGRRPPRRWNAE